MSRWKPWLRIGAITAVSLALLMVGRCSLKPREGTAPGLRPDATELTRIRALLGARSMSTVDLDRRVASTSILLVGESHLVNEPIAFLLDLLDRAEPRLLVLLLELPRATQDEIDRYLETGDERELRAIGRRSNALPYQPIIRWARRNADRVRRVVAIDEDFLEVGWNRLWLTDTRNETMARAIVRAREEFPDALAVAYGGATHMVMGGRSRLDDPAWRPAGARLVDAGIPRERMTSLLLKGHQDLPCRDALPVPAIVEVSGPVSDLPYGLFFDWPFFGVVTAGELIDVVVDLGTLTPTTD